jgi:hypothetical protein
MNNRIVKYDFNATIDRLFRKQFYNKSNIEIIAVV